MVENHRKSISSSEHWQVGKEIYPGVTLVDFRPGAGWAIEHWKKKVVVDFPAAKHVTDLISENPGWSGCSVMMDLIL